MNDLSSTHSGWLSQEFFSEAVKALPLVSVDLLVINDSKELLLGLRRNRPAQGWWFTPGARIRKNEPLNTALQRVWKTELNQSVAMPSCSLLGAWDHFYDDSAFSESVSTHYVNLPHLVFTSDTLNFHKDELPSDQHSQWNWVNIEQVSQADVVHPYIRSYAQAILDSKSRPTGAA